MQVSPVEARTRTAGFTIPHLRWWLAAILMLVSIINYLDRQALSILATTIQKDLALTTSQYAMVLQAFLAAYTIMHLAGGALVDRVGTRVAESAFILWWSVANMLTSLATGFYSLALCRTLLGLGEPGHYSASGKAVAEWFPPKERGIAVGMYVMGGTLGAALAGPVISFLAIHYGWRMAFVIAGALGIIPAVLWATLYRSPKVHPYTSESERRHVLEGLAGKTAARKVSWREVTRFRPLWVVMLSRALTDPIWLFYLFWFPKYLQETYSMTLSDLGRTVWVVYLSADAGSLLGGWLSGLLTTKGVPPVRARMLVMAGAAAILGCSFLMPALRSSTGALIMASLSTCAVMVWMTNSVTLPLDIFDRDVIGSVQGIIGAGGSIGGFISSGAVGYLVTHYSYTPAFVGMSALHPTALLLLWFVLPKTISHFERTVASHE
jgi:MFS transporter, ACS family, hexuronate transporter